MRAVEGMLQEVENVIVFLQKRVEKGEDFSDITAQEELTRIMHLREELLYFKKEY